MLFTSLWIRALGSTRHHGAIVPNTKEEMKTTRARHSDAASITTTMLTDQQPAFPRLKICTSIATRAGVRAVVQANQHRAVQVECQTSRMWVFEHFALVAIVFLYSSSLRFLFPSLPFPFLPFPFLSSSNGHTHTHTHTHTELVDRTKGADLQLAEANTATQPSVRLRLKVS